MNKDLADVFGNLVNRILVFSRRAFDGRIPAGGQFGTDERALANEVTARLASIRYQHEQLDFRRAAAENRALWVLANSFLQRAAPWSAGEDRVPVITRVTLNLVRLYAIAAHSIVPSLSGVVLGYSTITLQSRSGLSNQLQKSLMATRAMLLSRPAGWSKS